MHPIINYYSHVFLYFISFQCQIMKKILVYSFELFQVLFFLLFSIAFWFVNIMNNFALFGAQLCGSSYFYDLSSEKYML